MRRFLRSIAARAVVACAIAGSADAAFHRAVATGDEIPTSGNPPQVIEPGAMHTLSGVVQQQSQPVRGVRMTMFAAGRSIAQATTDTEGRYSLIFRSPIGRDFAGADPTIFVACVPPGDELAPEYGLVRLSARARELELFSPCTPRISLDQAWNVELRARPEQHAALRECWARASTPQH